MPARLSLALAVALALTSLAHAQTTLTAVRSSAPAVAPALQHAPYAGRYGVDGGAVEIVPEADGLAVIAVGAPVAARLAPLAADAQHLNDPAASVFAAWIGDDIDAVVAAVAPARRSQAAAHFAAHRSAFVDRLGAPTSARIVGTFVRPDGHYVTLAEVEFEGGTQWLSITWTTGGSIATLKRGLDPVVIGTARPAGTDRFDIGTISLQFGRGADGRIGSLQISDLYVAVR